MADKQIKSKDRVRNLAEVYTNEREVKAMLDLIPMENEDSILSYRYLEPACGNGNFTVEILLRKLKRTTEKYGNSDLTLYHFHITRAISLIYGIDICEENIGEAKERMLNTVKDHCNLVNIDGLIKPIKYILDKNFVVGDSINGADKIILTQFSVVDKYYYIEKEFRFSSLTEEQPEPIRVHEPKYFLDFP